MTLHGLAVKAFFRMPSVCLTYFQHDHKIVKVTYLNAFFSKQQFFVSHYFFPPISALSSYFCLAVCAMHLTVLTHFQISWVLFTFYHTSTFLLLYVCGQCLVFTYHPSSSSKVQYIGLLLHCINKYVWFLSASIVHHRTRSSVGLL